MKKSIIMAVLGVTASVAASYGQGYVWFDTYASNPTTAATFFNGASAGSTIGAGFTAELYFALGTVTDPVLQTAASITSPISGAFTAIPASISPVLANGTVQDATTVVVPGYSSGAISFEILFTGTGAEAAFSGRSGAFTESTLAASTQAPADNFGDNGPFLSSISVASSVPEPTTLALAGLGGLASLVAMRRKQA